MIDPYRMVLMSIIASFLFVAGFAIYKYIYPKKDINFFALVILISILPIISTFRPGVYESGDFSMHIYRGIDFYNNLKEGNFMPSWGGDLNKTVGYPVFIFNYILTYYILALLHSISISFIMSMKLLLASSYILSGIFMYLWAKKIFTNNLQAFTTSIFYLFGPYHLVVQHFRVNGEALAFTFLPLILLFVQKLLQKPQLITSLFIGILYGLFFLAHSASAVFSIPIVLTYMLLTIFLQRKNGKKKLFLSFLAIGIGILLANYVFVAHLVLGQYTYTSIVEKGVLYTDWTMLLYSPWRWGFLFQGHYGELGLIIGYTQLFVILSIIYLLLKRKIKKKEKYFVLFWLALCLLLSFLITPWSAIIWETIPILLIAQFSYRLLLFVVLGTALLAGYLVGYIKNKHIVYALIVITIGYTLLNWGNRGTIPERDDAYLIKNVPHATLNYEGMAIMASPKWLNSNHLWETKIPKNHLEVLEGKTIIQEISRTQTKHVYTVFAESESLLKENTLYFPGWQVFVDHKNTEIVYTDTKHLGKILFTMKPGLHYVEVYYEDIPVYKTAKQISAVGYILVIGTLCLLVIQKKQNK